MRRVHLLHLTGISITKQPQAVNQIPSAHSEHDKLEFLSTLVVGTRYGRGAFCAAYAYIAHARPGFRLLGGM